MEEKQLFSAALCFMLVGLLVLFLLTKGNIDSHDIDESESDVTVRGKVSGLRRFKKMLLIELLQQKPVDVVVFENPNMKVEEGQFLEVQGKVAEYNNQKQILAYKINLISS